MARLRNRKGVFVVIFGLMLVVLMGVSAMSIDMSRIWTMRNELQTSADAAALAGAIQLTPPHDNAYTVDSATAYALANRAMNDLVTVDSVQLGVWDDDLATFTNGAAPPNAVHVVVSHDTNKLIIGMLGIAAPRVKARATAWANAPVVVANCVKPWSIPYVTLMYRLNLARGITPANSAANLTRPFDQTADLQALQTMTEAERTFNLKVGSGKVNDDAPGGEMPGNFNAVKLPRTYDASTGTHNPDGTPPNGANAYRNHIMGPECFHVGIGDSLETETGNMTEPTIQGVTGDPRVCEVLVGEDTNTNTNDPTFGDCRDAEGNVGVTVQAAFHLCRTKCNGRTTVGVEMVGSFILKKVYPKKGSGFDKSEIVGVFTPTTAAGPIGSGSTTLNRLILVR